MKLSIFLNQGVTPKKSNVSTPLPEEEDLGEQERVLDSHIQSLRKERYVTLLLIIKDKQLKIVIVFLIHRSMFMFVMLSETVLLRTHHIGLNA